MIVFLQTLLSLLHNPSATASSSSAHLNVYDQPLSACSTSGMALTGFTRDGTCVEVDDDAGSHHICIDLSSTSSNGENFCQVTGQSNWCAESMPCSDSSAQTCPVQHWCVCQWAFSDYLQQAGGCDAIQEIDCDATNVKAVEAYRAQRGVKKYDDAYDCLVERCGLSISYA
ncbi:hypothetical protein ACHAXN_002414 [Cyclotella atomus]